ncbi:MAG: FAD-dependent oxidoreductase, partial [Acidobacteriota bacterium]
QAVSIPVIATGRISPRAGEEALRKGHADLIALARSLLADPYLPTKLADGRAKDIVPCLYCPACLDPGISAEGARCAVNPALGHDRELRLRPAGRSKRVVVIGGGPGGMEAARVAARRGHEVVLFERRAALGGRLLPWSGHESAQASIEQFRRYLTRQVCQSGVELRLGVRGSVDLVAAERPDTVVVATGGTSPDFQEPGLDGEQAIDAIEVLRGRPTGDTVAVIGAEFLGCDVALFLARQGKSVALLTERPRPAMEVTQAMAGFFLRELETHGVEQWNRVRFEERVASGVRISDRRGGAVTVPADSVVRATEARDRREEDALVNVLESHVPQVLTVGGGSGFLGLTEAIDGGYRAGCAVA